MGLILRRHPGSQTLIEQNILSVERFKLRIFGRSQFLGDKVVSPQIQRDADNANARHPQSRDRDEQHEEVQPALVGEGNAEDLRPEAVGGDHRVGLFRLGGAEGSEGVGFVAVFKEGVLDGGTVNGTQEGAPQHPSDPHHVEGVEGEVVEALDEEDETEDARYPKAGGEEPARLSQGVHQEDADEDGDGSAESDGVVGADAH